MVIIDECHRSGWGTWREILDHFSNAIHLGMTATPKQDENIDTYAYSAPKRQKSPLTPNTLKKGLGDLQRSNTVSVKGLKTVFWQLTKSTSFGRQ
jgi:Type I site-specific restriction-modification system, R (restriction) subunit and related helicases